MIYILNTYGVFLLYLLVLSYLWYIEKSKEEVAHIVSSAGVGSFVTLVVKQFFSIPRPYMITGEQALAGFSVHSSSLPSLHSALAFALATTVILHQKRFGIILYLLAAVIGFGRVAANVHYPVDIILGAVIGTLVSLAMERVHFPKIKA